MALVQEPSKEHVDAPVFTTKICLGVTSHQWSDVAHVADGGDSEHAGSGSPSPPSSGLPVRLRAGLVTNTDDITELVTTCAAPHHVRRPG